MSEQRENEGFLLKISILSPLFLKHSDPQDGTVTKSILSFLYSEQHNFQHWKTLSDCIATDYLQNECLQSSQSAAALYHVLTRVVVQNFCLTLALGWIAPDCATSTALGKPQKGSFTVNTLNLYWVHSLLTWVLCEQPPWWCFGETQ